MSMANINHLSSDMLAEILTRIPFRSVVPCKCVSKRWLSLISSPSFLDLFISRQHSFYKVLFLFLSSHHVMLSFHRNTPPRSLLPSPHNMLIRTGNLCGCSSGFLLCSSDRYTTGRNFYIYDPLDKECTHIPPSPDLLDEDSFTLYAVGFVCNPDGRFRVVLIRSSRRTQHEFEVECFISETWEWRLIPLVMFGHQGFAFAPHCLLAKAFEGKLYFMGSTCILVFHPFVNSYDIIYYPEDANPMNIISFGYLGQSCGSLRIADIGLNDVRVWECKDGYVWQLLHKIVLSTNLPAKFCANHFKCVGGFHPYDGDIMYLYSYIDGIFIVNLKTNKFQVVPGYEISDMSPFQLEMPF